MSETRDQLEEFMSNLLKLGNFDLRMEIEESPETIDVRLYGQDAELVLGNGARLLDSFNDLCNQIFFRRSGQRIEVDCEDHRLSRSIELRLLARNAAERARTGETVSFQPMTPNERRTIHVALADEGGVRTESMGTGPRRHVVVLPDASSA